ncbi:hypothetical protein INR49_026572 [Caranx melampygus]|nr:hypothetical protein INR49_026572 [Caranx melampygus]
MQRAAAFAALCSKGKIGLVMAHGGRTAEKCTVHPPPPPTPPTPSTLPPPPSPPRLMHTHVTPGR